MDEVRACMEELAKRHGKEGMRAIATLMHDLGSNAHIIWDGPDIPCDFLMQWAWEFGGSPQCSGGNVQ